MLLEISEERNIERNSTLLYGDKSDSGKMTVTICYIQFFTENSQFSNNREILIDRDSQGNLGQIFHKKSKFLQSFDIVSFSILLVRISRSAHTCAHTLVTQFRNRSIRLAPDHPRGYVQPEKYHEIVPHRRCKNHTGRRARSRSRCRNTATRSI